jgi:hypothetical protein
MHSPLSYCRSRARTAAICRKPCFRGQPCVHARRVCSAVPVCWVRSCSVGGRRESGQRPGYRGTVPGTVGGWRPLVGSCSQRVASGRAVCQWTRVGLGSVVSFRVCVCVCVCVFLLCGVWHVWTLGLVLRPVALSGLLLLCPSETLDSCCVESWWITETLLTMHTLRVVRSQTHLRVDVEPARSPMPRDQSLTTPPARFSETLADMLLASHASRCNCSQKLTNGVVIITSRLDLLHKT